MERSHTTNPLLDISGLPRFSAILPEHVGPALDQLLAENRRERERLLSANSSYTWANFAGPMEDMQERLQRVWSPVVHLNSVVNNEALRSAYNAAVPRITDYSTELAQDERLYRAYRAIANGPEFQQLSPAQRKIIENTLRDFRLSGAELSPKDKNRFREIQTELSMLASQFSENVLDATQAWELVLTDPKDVAGLPPSAMAMARQAAEREQKNGYKFGLDAPSYMAFMSYADNRALRQKMYEAYNTRASELGPNAGQWNNGPLIVQLLKLRREEARLLGFDNYAEYALQTRMAKTVPQVLEFLQELVTPSRPAGLRDLEDLKAYARSEHGLSDLAAWDVAYYSEKLRAHRYSFTQEELRPYFPENRVVPGMFEVVRRLYGLSIRAVEDVETWHPEVRFYEIRDEAGEVRGRFYIDLYARAHKRGGAWMDDCISRRQRGGDVQVPVAYLVCNFTPPVDGRPALFTHDEVNTLFHEFGHGLHHMLTKVDYVGVSGINGVAWDAVELPSQFMENWCWEREALDLISAHYQTGEHLPAALYEKMRAAQNFQSGMQFARQLEFALFDMRLHADFDPAGTRTVQQLLDEVRREVAVIIPPPINRFQNSFSHIFAGGYAAGYYSYKWAEVLSADAFSKFEENGVFDRRTGLEFLHNILEQGGVREPMELFVNFRGREPSIEPLLRHSGLAV
ncbi:MAG: oligopeptidase A [Gammaproteobacteria bacterium]|nr:oligopeptidase A [Gammaproteobacteria bacterium]